MIRTVMDIFNKGLFGKKVTLVQPIGENVVDDVCKKTKETKIMPDSFCSLMISACRLV